MLQVSIVCSTCQHKHTFVLEEEQSPIFPIEAGRRARRGIRPGVKRADICLVSQPVRGLQWPAMITTIGKKASWGFCCVLLAALAVAQEKPPALTVEGLNGKTVSFSVEQLKKMPRETVSVTNPHDQASQRYEGVRLSLLLAQAGAPSGKAMEGAGMRDYVEAIGSDKYIAVFALAELDSFFQDNHVIVADTVDGKPLDAVQGPLKLIVPQDHHPSRWVRMLVGVKLRQAPKE